MNTSNVHLYPWYLAYSFGLKWMQAATETFKVGIPGINAPTDSEVSAENKESQKFNIATKQVDEDIASTVAHELRTPLTSIRAFSEILHDNPDLEADQRGQYLNIIVQESEKLSDVVDQTLVLVEGESGAVIRRRDEGDLNKVMSDCLETIDAQIQGDVVQVLLRSPKQIRVISTDRDRIALIIQSLFSEAINCINDDTGQISLRMHITNPDEIQVDIFNDRRI